MKCPKCRLENPPNAMRCDCGYDLTNRVDHSSDYSLIKCKACGKDISKNADKCPHCGQKNENKNAVWQAIVGLIAVLFLLSNNSLYVGKGKVAILYKKETGFQHIIITEGTFYPGDFKWIVASVGTDGILFFEDLDARTLPRF